MSTEPQLKVCSWQDADKLLTYAAINLLLEKWYKDIRKGGSLYKQQGKIRNGRWRNGGEIPHDYEATPEDVGGVPFLTPKSWDIKSKPHLSQVCWYSLKCLVIQELSFSRSLMANKRLGQSRQRKYSKQRSRNS